MTSAEDSSKAETKMTPVLPSFYWQLAALMLHEPDEFAARTALTDMRWLDVYRSGNYRKRTGFTHHWFFIAC